MILLILLFINQITNPVLGGKAANLFHLQKIPGIEVPSWFCVSAEKNKQFLEQNQITEKIKKLDSLTAEKEIYEQAEKIRNAILSGKYSEAFVDEVHSSYGHLKAKSVAVRSSGAIEDMKEASFAGVYDTFLNQKSEKDVLVAIQKCWASVFNDRAVFERNSKHIKHSDALMGVIVQEMVDAAVSGTAFTLEVGTGYRGIEIAASYGLGEAVVDGEITVDKWVVHPETKGILKATLGDKSSLIESDLEGSGTKKIATAQDRQKEYALTPSDIKKIATQVEKIGVYFFKNFSWPYVDTEFAIDKTGKLYFLQARPLIPTLQNQTQAIDSEDAKNHQIVAKGRYSVPGVVSGRLKVISSWQELVEGKVNIESEDIVLTYVSTNCWTQYMTQFKGMITQEGGPTSHPILLCRERGVPCVIGIPKATFEQLLSWDGKWVTLDGINRTIYEGIVKTKALTPEDVATQFNPLQEEEILSYDQLIEDLQKYNVLLFEGDTVWQKKPSYPLDPLLQEINLIGYSKRAELLGIEDFPSEFKVLDNYVVEKFRSDSDKLVYFSHMDLTQCEAFAARQKKKLEEYEQLTSQYQLIEENWKSYVELMAELRAYIWLGFPFRLYVNQQLAHEGQKLQIPRYYVEAYAKELQSTMEEEDVRMMQAIAELADDLKSFSKDCDIAQLQIEAPEIYKKLEQLAKNYRFNINLSFNEELNLDKVLQRCIAEKGEYRPLLKPSSIEEEYFPEDKDLKRWIAVATASRILQSNSHHIITRGQWAVREALLTLGQELVAKGCLEKPEEIFNSSVEQISFQLASRSKNHMTERQEG